METLEEAKQLLRDNWKAGVECPCCSQNVKQYSRPLHTTMALTLIRLNNLGEGYHHVKKIVKGISDTGTNDFSKLRYWGLIVEQKNDTEKRTSGSWAITHKGRQFVNGELAIQKNVLLYNKKSYGLEGEPVTIMEVLGNKFDYQELMGLK